MTKRSAGGAQAIGGKHAGKLHPRSKMPVPLNDLALKRRRQIADRLRRPKPKDADDPVRLGEEASHWHKALTNQEVRSLIRLLDELDVTNPRRRVRVVEKLPPAASVLVQAAYRDLCKRWQRNPTEPLLLRMVVARSADRHPLEELQTACHTELESHRKGMAKLLARIRAEIVAEEEAEFTRQLLGQGTPPSRPVPSAAASPAPAPASQNVRR